MYSEVEKIWAQDAYDKGYRWLKKYHGKAKISSYSYDNPNAPWEDCSDDISVEGIIRYLVKDLPNGVEISITDIINDIPVDYLTDYKKRDMNRMRNLLYSMMRDPAYVVLSSVDWNLRWYRSDGVLLMIMMYTKEDSPMMIVNRAYDLTEVDWTPRED